MMPKRYAFFVLMKATRDWLGLARSQRNDYAASHLNPLFERYSGVSVRFFDAEAFSTLCSDVALFETDDPREYAFLMEGLRDTAIFTVPYFEFTAIIPAIEGGFIEYEEQLELSP